jgi:metal-dependent amidase/aminoacylase/carboxypeptidase family protein
LLEDPLYDTLNTSPRVEYCFGLHLTSMLGCHKLGYEVGPVTAMTDKWEIHIVGKGGHANNPESSVDALQIGI